MDVEKNNKPAQWLADVVLALMIGLAGLVLAACQPTEQPAAPQGFLAGGQRPNFQIEPAQELPTAAPAVTGAIVKRDGNTLVVRGIQDFRSGASGTPRPAPGGTSQPRPTPGGGTEVQIELTNDTIVYKDVTLSSLNGQPPSGTIQQKVETSRVDDIRENNRVTIWGEQSGDHIIANVVVFSELRAFQQQ